MGMFLIKKGTPVRIVDFSRVNYPGSIVKLITTKDIVFGKEDLTIDPTGIAWKYTAVPQNVKTIGGDYAKKGYYGFNYEKHTMLVASSYVKYG